MAIAVMTWVLEEAPDLPGHCFAVLMALASKAREDGTGARPGQQWLADRTRKTARQVRSDLAKLEDLGLIRRGDQGLVAHLPADEAPVVWDLAIERLERKPASAPSDDVESAEGADESTNAGRERKPTSGRQSTSGRKQASGGERKQASGDTSPETTNSPPTGESARAHAGARGNSTPRGDGRIPLPDDFSITDAMRRWAKRDGYAVIVDVDYETAQFISHHRSESTRKASWPDEWQKWIRRSAKFVAERNQRQAARDPTAPGAHKANIRTKDEWMHRR